MLIAIEIGMLIFGVYALITGKLPLNAKNVVRGAAARWLSALAILPLPLAFSVGFAIGFTLVAQGRNVADGSFNVKMSLIEAGITFGCLFLMYAIGFPIAKRQNREREDEERELEWLDDEQREDRRWRKQRRRDRDEDREDDGRPAAKPPPLPKLPATGPAPALSDIRFSCSGCGSAIEVDLEHGGRKVRCPKCQAVQLAPTVSTDAVIARPGGPRPTV